MQIKTNLWDNVQLRGNTGCIRLEGHDKSVGDVLVLILCTADRLRGDIAQKCAIGLSLDLDDPTVSLGAIFGNG